ncbi:zinc-binding dehydrogenase [Novosphingobium sp. KCTC 2891]|uniref:zinc-binding dehydrogenase n=1 Tax=Novosphingobium sp. KCTC 2891 TaxID=2989730 RepID=UPI002223A0FE|nr:zinc-binding dehydrogenase [Novosphingobium sp. KCTC 2891]MCW1383608.1 zinc-binding dehydrogenase [Novosphingobium sp. KCTC 2891]
MPIISRAAIAMAPNQPLILDKIKVDEPGEGEVLVEIKVTGLCHTDLSAIEGKMSSLVHFPGVPGHEAGGVVVEVGPGVTSLAVGDHVIPYICTECGHCDFCHSPKTNLCTEMFTGHDLKTRAEYNGVRLHSFHDLGTFSNFGVYREISLAKVRKDAPFEQIAYLGCGATTGLGAALIEAKVESGATVAVIGLGGIGLSVVQGARICGASRIIAVDTNPSKEALARKMGATEFVNPKTIGKELGAYIVDITGAGADYVFECVGSIATIQQAFAATHFAWGTCMVVGLPPDGEMLPIPPAELLFGKTLKGSSIGGAKCRTGIPQLVDRLMDGEFDLDSLITAKIPLDRISDGLEMMKRGEGIRTVVMY